MPRPALELFLSLGVTAGVLATAITAPPALAQHQHHGTNLSAQGDEGGEGGEGAEAGHAAAVQSDLDVLVVLAQMQGHLLVAQELLDQQHFRSAEPHVGHPVDELYGALEPALQSRGLSPFLPALEALRQQVRLKPNSPESSLKLAQAQNAIAAVAQAVNGEVPPPAPLVLAMVRQLGETATEEYAAAVAGDQVVEEIEYQDARGFLLEAQRLLTRAIAGQPGATTELMARQRTVAAMFMAFATAMPPQKAVVSVAQLQQLQQEL